MKNTRKFLLFQVITLLLLLILANSCKKEETKQKPVLSTSEISEISETKAKSGGNIINSGGAAITARGVCWSIGTTPLVTDNKTIDGAGEGTFVSNLTGLSAGKTYNIRAYATNSVGTGYGNTITFSTSEPPKPVLPIITTSPIASISPIAARSGGNITSDGGAPIIIRGVCWSIDTIPDIWDNKTTNGAGTGSFLSDLAGLTPGTTYYLRAYAINSAGTSYGDVYPFTTQIYDIDGNTYNIVTIGTQVWMAENLKTTKYNNGDSIPVITYSDPRYKYTGTYCNYDNLPGYKDGYGLLYNFYAVVDSRNLCPSGWHVPTEDEWTTLIAFEGGVDSPGAKLKEVGTEHWYSQNIASNSSGFSARGGGNRAVNIDGLGGYENFKYYGIFWTSSIFDYEDYGPNYAFQHAMANGNYDIGTTAVPKQYGNSVRCIQN
jgi:uncharacterized protein (TIGR02145 family)